MAITSYDPGNWYWFVGGDQTQVFSGKGNAFVAVNDATFLAWGGTPTAIDTLDNLKAVLTDAGIPPYRPVSPAAARVVLAAAGKLAAVEAAVNAAPQPVQLYWEYSTEIHRTHPYVEMLRQAIGMSAADADALFTAAAATTS